MAFTSIYYTDTIEPVSGWRYRLEFQPAYDYDADITGDTRYQQPLLTLPPAFMADPGVGSIYLRLPEDVVEGITPSGSEYDGWPLGTPSPPTLKVGFNLTRLDLFATETSDTCNVAVQLLSPARLNGGIIRFDDPHGVDPQSFEFFDTYNLIRYSTDGGNAALAVADFEVAFIGTQNPLPSATIKTTRVPERAMIEVEFTHILKVCLETVTPGMFALRFLGDHAGLRTPSNAQGTTQCIYDFLYGDGVWNYGRAHASYRDEDGHYDKARLYHIRYIASVLVTLMEDVYYNFTRLNIGATISLGFRSLNTNHPQYDAAYNHHTPYSVYKFFEQDHTVANAAGTSLLGSLLPENNIYFIGLVWRDTSDTSVGNFPYEDAIGGFLSESDDNGVYSFPNMWDFLKRWADGTLCKVQYKSSVRDQVLIYFNPLKKSIVTDTARRNLRTQDFRRSGGDSEDATIEIGGEVVSGAVATMPGMGGEDESTVEVKLFGSRVDNDGGLELVFHNSPTIGDAANRYQMTTWTDDEAYNPDIDAPFVIGASTGFHCRTLYYIATPSMSNNEIAIRVHDTVGVDFGDGYIVDGEVTALPSYSGTEYELFRDFDNEWWNTMVARMKGIQLNSCLGYATAYRGATLFGDPSQAVIMTEVDLGFAYLMDIGDRYTFVNDAGTYAAGNVFLDSATYLSAIPGRPYLTKVEPNYVDHTAKITLLSPPT